MKLWKMKRYLTKVICISPNGHKLGNDLIVEYEDKDNYDQFQFCLTYDFEKKRFKCYFGVYHAGEDNNCENQEGHTDEYESSNKSLRILLKELKEDYEKDFVELFYDDMLWTIKQQKLKEAK